MRLIGLADIREKGIRFTRQHIYRLVREGEFPRPIKVGSHTNVWVEAEIDQYIADRIAARDKANT